MAQTTFANGRGIAHKGSGGMSTVFPDVCLTPVGGASVPIPYPNTAKASDTSEGPSTVRCDGEMPMVKGAKYSKSTGDEPGTDGGVSSGVNEDVAEFSQYSMDVCIEGDPVCRLGDSLLHNKSNASG